MSKKFAYLSAVRQWSLAAIVAIVSFVAATGTSQAGCIQEGLICFSSKKAHAGQAVSYGQQPRVSKTRRARVKKARVTRKWKSRRAAHRYVKSSKRIRRASLHRKRGRTMTQRATRRAAISKKSVTRRASVSHRAKRKHAYTKRWAKQHRKWRKRARVKSRYAYKSRRYVRKRVSHTRRARGHRSHLMAVLKKVKPAGLPLRLAAAVVTVESGWRPSAVGRAGEVGLMQLRKSTARAWGWRGGSLKSPHVNLRVGTRYLHYCYRRARGNIAATIGCYNRGPGNMWQWHKSRITRAYVRKVRAMMRRSG